MYPFIALCDREPEHITAFAQKEFWRAKFNPRNVYDSLDAFVIITQPRLHALQCIQAMESGKVWIAPCGALP